MATSATACLNCAGSRPAHRLARRKRRIFAARKFFAQLAGPQPVLNSETPDLVYSVRGRLPMLAGMRSCFLLFLWLAFSVAAWLPLPAQVNGVPPSVTSIGFGGGNAPHGVPPSVTSIGFGGSSAPRGVPPGVTSLGPSGYSDS